MADDTPTAPGALQIAPDRHRASCALNLAEWLRLGLRMQFPPVRPGQKSIPESAKKSAPDLVSIGAIKGLWGSLLTCTFCGLE